jgi:hypothetical protein
MNARVLLAILLGLLLLGAAGARAAISPESQTTQVRSVRPGEVYRGTLVVRNNGKSATDVKVYQTDYSFTAEGQSHFGTPGAAPRSNAAWLRLSQEQIAIAPGERGRVDYEVRVPDDPRLSGTYWSAVMIEEVVGEEAPEQRRDRTQVRQVIRHLVQVITEIGTSGKGEIAFHNARLLNEQGKRWLSVDIENTGERWLRTEIYIELHDRQGRAAGRFSGSRARTFPATSVRNRIDLSAVPPGEYLALLVADAGRDDLFGTQIELVVH